MPEQARTSRGFGRVLVAVYAIFALSATARSGVQLATGFSDAPLAYLLSGLAAVVYVVATIALARGAERTAVAAIGVEAAGVLGVGLLSVMQGALFADATVWSDFGRGYGYVPLVLPAVGLWWLRRVTHRSPT